MVHTVPLSYSQTQRSKKKIGEFLEELISSLDLNSVEIHPKDSVKPFGFYEDIDLQPHYCLFGCKTRAVRKEGHNRVCFRPVYTSSSPTQNLLIWLLRNSCFSIISFGTSICPIIWIPCRVISK